MLADIVQIVGSAILAALLVVWWLSTTHAGYSDFDFSTGLGVPQETRP